MKLVLNRDNITQFIESKGSYVPKIYTRSSIFKNEYFKLESIKDGVAKYKFLYERGHEDGLIRLGFKESGGSEIE